MARVRASGWWYPWIFVGAMLVVIAVNAVMITMAIRTFPGLAAEDAYQKGIDYNQTLAEARGEEQRGWRADVRFDPRAGEAGAGDLVVGLSDAGGRPLDNMAVSAELIRPTRGGLDRHVTLRERGPGLYGGPVALPLPGQWDAHLWVRSGDEVWQTTRRIRVP